MMEATLNDPQWSRMFMVNTFECFAFKHLLILRPECGPIAG